MSREPSAKRERVLRDACSFVLQVPSSDIILQRSFVANGGDSISAMRVSPRCKADGVLISVATLLASRSLADAAAAASSLGTAAEPPTTDEVGGVKQNTEATTSPSEAEPFSLLNLDDGQVDMLREKVASTLRIPATQVLEMAPTTHTQALCVDAAMHTPPQGCYVFYIDIPQTVQLGTITDFTQKLWNQVEIFRTVFVQHPVSSDILQVVTEPSPVNLEIHALERANNISETSETIFEESIQSPLELGAIYVKFIVLHRPETPTRLAFRVSHAHYDGMSLPPILDCLAAHLQEEPWPEMPRFVGYVTHVLNQSERTLKHWKSTLSGSQALTLHPTGDESRILTSARVINKPPKSASFTEANVFLAACAETLARLHDTRDVNFTLTVSGRTTLPEKLVKVVGPCLNQVPLRVALPSEPSFKAAVSLVRLAHLDVLAAEIATVQDIYKVCTDWPEKDRKMAYNVHFNDLVSRSTDLLGDGVQVPLLVHGPRGVWEHSQAIWIIATPVDGSWQISLSGNASHCSAKHLEQIADTMVNVLSTADI